jgi:dTDP-4-dehydrorhamnose 3,5-epimerase
MIFTETTLHGAYIIDIDKKEDERGFYARGFCRNEFESMNLKTNIAQANIIYTKEKATLRGLHLQLPPYVETKLIRCTKGSIFDVIIDLRPGSATFLKHFGIDLTADNFKMVYVPEGFAHGYLTLENDTHVAYHVTEFYTPGFEKGIRWNDPALNIQWPLQPQIISAKDKNFPDYVLES